MSDGTAAHWAQGGELRDRVDGARNAGVLAWLGARSPAAHTDPGGLLLAAAKAHPGAIAWSPSFGALRYVALIVRRTIVAVAFGQQDVAVRLPAEAQPRAHAVGAEPFPELGSGWVRAAAFGSPGRVEAVQAWLREALAAGDTPEA